VAIQGHTETLSRSSFLQSAKVSVDCRQRHRVAAMSWCRFAKTGSATATPPTRRSGRANFIDAKIAAERMLEAYLADQPYVAGNRFTIGDIPTGAAVYRWLIFDLERPSMPKIAAWQARLAEHKGFRLHVASREYHLAG
jgi:glutathione S-transferase